MKKKVVEIFIFYDSFVFIFIKKCYSIYKKKLYVVVIFAIKYDYFCRHFYQLAVIHTNHKSIIHFFAFDMHEKIYDNWIDKLKKFNVEIHYIFESRNKIVDALSRILFNENCSKIFMIKIAKNELDEQKFKWVWKNEKKDFKDFLKFFLDQHEEIIKENTIHELFVFALKILVSRIFVIIVAIESKINEWMTTYKISHWFENIYNLLNESLKNSTSKIIEKSLEYCLIEFIFWRFYRDKYLLCISKEKIREILKNAHDDFDYWAKIEIMTKFLKTCYWSKLSKNMKKYVKKCLKCAKHEFVIKFQSLHSIQMCFFFNC